MNATLNDARSKMRLAWFAALSVSVLPLACSRSADTVRDELIVYCSIDEVFGRSVLDAYQARTGRKLSVVFDSEAGKTTGLVNKIIREADSGRSRADVFWSSELFNTILLGRRGLLEPYDSPSAADIPKRFKDAQHRWTALAARARVLAFAPRPSDIDSAFTIPSTWEQLADPRFARRLSFANPLFGTTRGHVAAMFALWGEARGRAFLTGLRDGGVRIADGNSATVRDVIAGRTRWGATDTDDVWVAQRAGETVELIYPDMGDGGTLMIPCSVAIIKGTTLLDEAHHLVDYLVSAEVERMLAQSDSRNVPVRESLRNQLGIAWPAASKVEYEKVADAMDETAAAVREILLR